MCGEIQEEISSHFVEEVRLMDLLAHDCMATVAEAALGREMMG